MNEKTIENHFKLIQGIFFIIGIGLMLLYADNQILRGDQTQMLYKGYLGAYQDTWLSFGNAASAVGNVPGSLSAWIVGLPLLLWDNPWSPMLVVIFLRVISFFLLDSVIKQVFSRPIRLFFILLYWLNPWLLYDSLLYNPSYLVFFSALHFWSAFKLKDSPSFFYSMLHVLAIGGVMQLHYSWPVLAVISCYLLYRKMSHPSWAGVFTGVVILLVSLIPYFQEYMVNESISRESDRYIGYGLVHVYPVIKAVIYWLRFASTLFSNRIITDANFDWLTQIEWIKMIVKYTWQAMLFIIGAATVILSAKINWQSWKLVKPQLKRNVVIENDKSWILLFAAATVIAVIVNAMLSPITFSYWHLILIFPLTLLPILLTVENWYFSNETKFYQLFAFISVFFIVVNLVAANDSDKYSYKVNYQEQVKQYLDQEGLIK